MSVQLTNELLDKWATDPSGPVGLHLKQKLLPVEGEGGVIFPPTYADIGYNIDTLSDGTKVATIDSVGSQANRMEPMFKRAEYTGLVPQIEIVLNVKEADGEKYERRQSLLDLAHRSADAVVKATPELLKIVAPAFDVLNRHGNAGPLCAVAPTSLLFGVWDSRDGTGEKRPRLVRSIIRAWNVEPLFSAAQFNSTWKTLDAEQQQELEKEARARKTKLSEKGFADAPAVFRKVSQNAAKQMLEFRNGSPNPERRTLGGVLVNGAIERTVTVNLVALRAISGELAAADGKPQVSSADLRRYLLALALLAGTADQDLFLREGCQLRYAGDEIWCQVPRRGAEMEVDLVSDSAQKTLSAYAKQKTALISEHWPPTDAVFKFDIKEAKKIIAKKDAEEESSAS
ncbi:MAG: type I-U CRISPR-associated RAMP protein Csb1/Cas7u [Solimonas sp.]